MFEAGLTRTQTLQGKKAGSLRRFIIGKTVTYPTKGGVVHVLFTFGLLGTIAAVHIPDSQSAISKTCSKKRGYDGFT